MVRYLDPRNWLALEVRSSDGEPRLLRRQDDATISTVYTSVVGTGMRMMVRRGTHPTILARAYDEVYLVRLAPYTPRAIARLSTLRHG